MPTGRKEKFETVNRSGLAPSSAQSGFPSRTTVIRKGSKYGKIFDEGKQKATQYYKQDDGKVDDSERAAARQVGADDVEIEARVTPKLNERTKYAK